MTPTSTLESGEHRDCATGYSTAHGGDGHVDITWPCGATCTLGNFGPILYQENVAGAHKAATGVVPPVAVDLNSDEGMLREAADVLRFGVKTWRSSTFAWVVDDLLARIDAKYPGSKDVIDGADIGGPS